MFSTKVQSKNRTSINQKTDQRGTSFRLTQNRRWQLGYGYSFVIPSNSFGKLLLR
jgi:hypothetical protein